MVDEKAIQRAIKEVDKIGKGKLSFREFKQFITKLFNPE
jgi:Ca2+-binding EF-hand superfamily protein